MVWQDITITIANLLFTYALVPQVYHGFKTKKKTVVIQTSLLTTLGLYSIGIAFITLGLLFSGIVSTINATLWALILIQGLIYP
jgi:glycerol-3-phosphate responsive antiterminator